MTHENAALIEKIKAFYKTYDETKGANATDIVDLCSDQVRWKSLGTPAEGFEFIEDGTGKEKVRTYLRDLYQGWSMIHYTAVSYTHLTLPTNREV